MQGGFKQEVVILLNILVKTIFGPILSCAILTKEKGFAISGQYGKLPLSFLSLVINEAFPSMDFIQRVPQSRI